MIPVIGTPRLVLRGPRPGDFPPMAAFWASPRARHEGGPRDEARAWEDFAAAYGLWLVRGYGAWSVEHRGTGAFVGQVGIWQPSTYPEPDLGWTVTAEWEGKGLAFEAAAAARDWIWANTALPALVSCIDPDNARSIRLALRLGGERDPEAAGIDPGDVVIRHRRPEARP